MSNPLPNKIRQLIERNELMEAAQLIVNSSMKNEGIIHISKIQELTTGIRLGTIRTEEKDLQMNRLRQALLQVADILETHKESSAIYLNEVPGLGTEIIGRSRELELLHKELQNSQSILLLRGIGGIGKTTLAKAYIRKYQSSYDHIIWVCNSITPDKQQHPITHAISDDAILHQSLGLPFDSDISKEDRLLMVLHRLRNLPGKNLMILDNAGLNSQSLISKLPASPSWHIIVTSREELSDVHIIRLDELSSEEATELFYLHYPKGRSYADDVKELVATIGFHTLTIELLAKSCQKGKLKRLNPKKILNKIQQKQFDTIQKKVFSQHSKSEIELFTYLNVAFDLSGLSEEEENILRQWTVLPSIDISAELVIQLFNFDEDTVPDAFETAIESLVQKGWLLYNQQGECFRCHQLIQEVIRYQLPPTESNCAQLIQGVSNLLNFDRMKENPATKFPYVVFGEQILSDLTDIENGIGFQRNLASVYQKLGRYKDSAELFEMALESGMKQLGMDHSEVLITRSHLASVYQDLGRYAEAEELLHLVLQSTIEKFGENKLEVANAKSNLACVYQGMGQYKKAEELHTKALQVRIQQLGINHLDVATSRSHLAKVFQKLGRFQEAENLHRMALQSRLTSLGEDHPDVASSRSYLASLYQDLGRFIEAADLYKSALEVKIQNLGDAHPDVSIIRSQLGSVYKDLGQFEDAETLLTLALKNEHPNSAAIQSILASIYQERGKQSDAATLLEQALHTTMNKLGKNHPDIAAIRSNLASVYQDLGRYEEAESLYLLALQSRINHLGEAHPDVAAIRSNLASVYQESKRQHEAKILYQQVLQSDILSLGENHPYVIRNKNLLANLN